MHVTPKLSKLVKRTCLGIQSRQKLADGRARGRVTTDYLASTACSGVGEVTHKGPTMAPDCTQGCVLCT